MRYGLAAPAALATLALVACPPPPQEQGPAAGTPEWKIENAMSAAPAALARHATIMDWPATQGGQPSQLRPGTNEWVCFPDSPQTPTNDPMCLDKVWQAWADAWMNRKPFTTTVAGVGYMLQGGSAVSGTDPYAEFVSDSATPWHIEPPHLMWIAPTARALEGLPTDPAAGGPWVMWKGTPYVHVMIPVR